MNNLRNIRKKRGISLKQLHEMTGIPFRTLEDWDGEKRQIQAYHRIKMLAKVLECDMDDLMVKEEECLYNGEDAVICMIQEENGVSITVIADIINPVAKAMMPREDALDLLKHIKVHKEISNFLSAYIN